MSSFLSLSTDLVVGIFPWLTAGECVTLDTAFVGNNSREQFLSHCSSPSLEFGSLSDSGSELYGRSKLLTWALDRKYNFRRMVFDLESWFHWCDLFSTYTRFPITTHLEFSFGFLTHQLFNNEAFSHLLNLCPQLQSVVLWSAYELDFVNIFSAVKDPNIFKKLTELSFNNVHPTELHFLTVLGTFLSSNLVVAEIDCTSCAADILSKLVVDNAHSLTTLALWSASFSSDFFTGLTKCCQLKNVSLDSDSQPCMDVFDNSFREIFKTCQTPQIETFLVSCTQCQCVKVFLSDKDKVEYVLELTLFHSPLEMCKCLEECGPLITLLTFCHCNCVSDEQVVRCIGQKCKNVKAIAVNSCGEETVCTAGLIQLVAVAESQNQVRSLIVNPCEELTPEDFVAICNSNMLLEYLVVQYSSMTVLDVKMCLTMCPGLKKIVCDTCSHIAEYASVSFRKIPGEDGVVAFEEICEKW